MNFSLHGSRSLSKYRGRSESQSMSSYAMKQLRVAMYPEFECMLLCWCSGSSNRTWWRNECDPWLQNEQAQVIHGNRMRKKETVIELNLKMSLRTCNMKYLEFGWKKRILGAKRKQTALARDWVCKSTSRRKKLFEIVENVTHFATERKRKKKAWARKWENDSEWVLVWLGCRFFVESSSRDLAKEFVIVTMLLVSFAVENAIQSASKSSSLIGLRNVHALRKLSTVRPLSGRDQRRIFGES